MANESSEIRVAIVAPTFNNAGTLADVLRALHTLGLPIIVVNDGSTDGTADVLTNHPIIVNAVTVLSHSQNRGKAAAMRIGFDHAHAAGFTHAVTIDTDGQHDPADIPALLAASRLSPNALVVGSRPAAVNGCPAANLAGRKISNLLVRLEGGVAVADSQCGLRVYPLAETLAIPARAARFGFETEILIRFGWAQLPVIEVPASCVYDLPGGRVTHFRRGRDTWAAIRMHFRLLNRSLWPWPPKAMAAPAASGTLWQRFGRWINPMTAWRTLRTNAAERPRFAVALSAGVMIANLPVYGLQSILSLIVARRFRLSPLAVLAGSHASMPPLGPLLIALAIGVGHWLLHGEFLTLADLDPHTATYFQLLRRVALDWTIGSIVCGLAMAALTYCVARFTLARLPVIGDAAPAN